MLVSVLLFGLSAASCLTSAELTSYGISPADRNIDKLTPAYFNWESARFAAGVCKILLRDAMGYEIDEYESYGGSGSLFGALDDGSSNMDFVTELWEESALSLTKPYTVDSNILTSMGRLGYAGSVGWHIPDYMMNMTGVTLNDWMMGYYQTYNKPNVINALSSLNISDFILNNPNLAMSAQPNWSFEPEHCHTMTCIDVILMSESWETNFWQAQVVNLQLPFRLTYWGYGGMHKLAKSLYSAQENFIFYAFEPDPLLSQINGVPITFPKATDACFLNYNTSNNEGKYSSINCDYPNTNFLKISRTSTFEHPAAEEGKTFLSQFQMSRTDIDWMFAELRDNYNWIISWDLENTELDEIACKWIKAHSETWKP